MVDVDIEILKVNKVIREVTSELLFWGSYIPSADAFKKIEHFEIK